nr:hypothetical protein [Tanacetum cinerariifolium]
MPVASNDVPLKSEPKEDNH